MVITDWAMRNILLAALMFSVFACGDSPPTVPGNFIVNAISASDISSTWDVSMNHGGISEYEVWRDNSFLNSTQTTGYIDSGLANATAHCYSVRAVGQDSNDISEFTETLCATTFPYNDVSAPETPTALVANAISDSEIELTWEPSSDDLMVVGYNVYRDAEFINSVTLTRMIDTALLNTTQYCYVVTAYDSLDQESIESLQECATTLDPP